MGEKKHLSPPPIPKATVHDVREFNCMLDEFFGSSEIIDRAAKRQMRADVYRRFDEAYNYFFKKLCDLQFEPSDLDEPEENKK